MRKVLFLSIIFWTISVQSKAQGLKLTGASYNNVADSVTYTTLYSYPVYSYSLVDSTLNIAYPCARSIYAAKKLQYFTTFLISNYSGKSTIGIPTAVYLLSISNTYLNGLGFTVTTFP